MILNVCSLYRCPSVKDIERVCAVWICQDLKQFLEK